MALPRFLSAGHDVHLDFTSEGRTCGRCNHVAHTCVQRLILSALPLIFVEGLVGALRGEGSGTIVARESFYQSHIIPIRSGL